MQTFISYRHADSKEVTQQQIYPLLVEKLGADHVFLDRESVRPGDPFPERIREALELSYSVVVVIGPRWIEGTESGGQRRLWDEGDYVRTEVALALRWKISVYPVLLHQRKMPASKDLPPDIRKLTRLNAIEVQNLATDIGRLTDELHDLRSRVRRCAGVEWLHRCRRRTPYLLCGKHSRQVLLLLALLGLTTAGGFVWREQDWVLAPVRAAVPNPPPLQIVEPRDSATAGPEVLVRGTSPFRGQPHYVVVSSGQQRYVVDPAVDLAWNGSWRAAVPLGSGAQGIGQWFGIQVLTAEAGLAPGPLVANPPDARSSPAVSVFRSH